MPHPATVVEDFSGVSGENLARLRAEVRTAGLADGDALKEGARKGA